MINILLAIAVAALLIGVIGEEDKERHKNITIAFVTILLFILCINMIN